MTLNSFFKQYNKVALAFSGGVDSAFLLYSGIKAGADICAYYVKSEFQPEFELEDAKRLASELGAKIKIIEISVLGDCNVAANSEKRCYYCKKQIFTRIKAEALKDGYEVIIDGTNASDDISDRPGFFALSELGVISPLRDCGITKDEIRIRSKESGLFTHDKPAYACLATRIKTGDAITKQSLEITEKAENAMFNLGFRDFRVRKIGDNAKIQIKKDQFQLVIDRRDEINKALGTLYKSITLDLEERK